ncbi:2-deoxyglucose-6-phosphate phosphatase 2 [Monosporozyma servazzii]
MPSLEVDNCLFDLDGTIVSTIVAAESVWTDLCKQHGVDPKELFKYSHGCRTGEVLAKWFPQLDNTDNKVAVVLERHMADDYTDTVTLIPGAHNLLVSLDKDTTTGNKLQRGRKWAIVTSATPYIAHKWFGTILKDVGKPDVFITANDVTKGKPDPQGFQAAYDRLCQEWGVPAKEGKTVIFEDSPLGIQAGKSMGCYTIGITTSYSTEKLLAAGADYVVADLTHVAVTKNSDSGKITLTITDPLN